MLRRQNCLKSQSFEIIETKNDQEDTINCDKETSVFADENMELQNDCNSRN